MAELNRKVWQQYRAPREILLSEGAQALSDRELLAIFLRIGVRGTHVMALSQQILEEFGSIEQLMMADYATFCAMKGLGTSKYAQLHAAIELSRRFFHTRLIRENTLGNPEMARAYLQNVLSHKEREVFLVMFLDSQHRVIKHEEMFAGTINSVEVHPREVVREALKQNASAIILAHNHPSGMAEPSDADRKITQRIVQACDLLEIRVLDHLVIGRGEYVSFAERGWV